MDPFKAFCFLSEGEQNRRFKTRCIASAVDVNGQYRLLTSSSAIKDEDKKKNLIFKRFSRRHFGRYKVEACFFKEFGEFTLLEIKGTPQDNGGDWAIRPLNLELPSPENLKALTSPCATEKFKFKFKCDGERGTIELICEEPLEETSIVGAPIIIEQSGRFSVIGVVGLTREKQLCPCYLNKSILGIAADDLVEQCRSAVSESVCQPNPTTVQHHIEISAVTSGRGNEETSGTSGDELTMPELADCLMKLKIEAAGLNEEQKKDVYDMLTLQATIFMKTRNYSKVKVPGVRALIEFLESAYNQSQVAINVGSLIITLNCKTLKGLDQLWKDYLSGHLNKVAEWYLVTDEMKKKLNLRKINLKTTIDEKNYFNCRKILMESSGEADNTTSSSQQSAVDQGTASMTGIATAADDEELLVKQESTAWMIRMEKARTVFTRGKKMKKPDKDLNAPKSPSARISEEHREKIQAENQDLPFHKVAKIPGNMGCQSTSRQKPQVEEAEEDSEHCTMELQQYPENDDEDSVDVTEWSQVEEAEEDSKHCMMELQQYPENDDEDSVDGTEGSEESTESAQSLQFPHAFDPAPYIEFICQRCEDCEGWLAPFPWCKEFRFRLDNIFTRLKFVSRKKQRGIKTDHIVDMFQIFQPHEECSQPRRVLIEGQPGKGKTTYCQKIAYDWAKKQKGRDSFADVQIVLLLKCRDIISGLWDAIDDQLLPREIDEKERERFFSFISKHQSKVLVVLDGLDELPTSQLPKYEEVIQGTVLPKCYLVVTARHEAGIKVREYCHTLLEVEGFTMTDAEIFIKRYFKEKESLAKELLDKLNSDETLQDLAANPLNAALLCLLCEDFHGKLPQSRTVLYFEIIECVLRRYRERIKLPEKDEDLVALYQVELKDLGYIALEGLKNDRMKFEQSAFQGSSSNAIIGFGFLSVEPGQSKLRPSRCYAFLHKSLQEFLAAFYLCCQLVDEKIFPDSLVADHRYFEEFQQVLMFTVGLLAQKSKAKAKALIASIGHQVNLKDEFRYVKVALCCINECREEQSTFDKELAKDLGLLLRVKKLAFSRIGKGAFAALVEVMKTNLTLQDLYVDWSEIGDEGLILLAEVLPENSKLRKLCLNQCKVTDVGASALAQTLKKIPLSELCLSENSISDEGVAALAQALEENSTLRTLDLSCGLIGDQGITKIAEVLVKNSTLTNLDVSNNCIGNRGGDVLAKALAENSTLSKIELAGNLIDDKYATTLAEGLKNNSTLTCLNLSRNDIHYAGAAALVQAVEKNTTLTMLDLSENELGNEHVSLLEDALKEIQHKVKASKLELVLYSRHL